MTKQNRRPLQINQLDNHALRTVTGGLSLSVMKKQDDTTAETAGKIG
jgi:hypothetical protein